MLLHEIYSGENTTVRSLEASNSLALIEDQIIDGDQKSALSSPPDESHTLSRYLVTRNSPASSVQRLDRLLLNPALISPDAIVLWRETIHNLQRRVCTSIRFRDA